MGGISKGAKTKRTLSHAPLAGGMSRLSTLPAGGGGGGGGAGQTSSSRPSVDVRLSSVHPPSGISRRSAGSLSFASVGTTGRRSSAFGKPQQSARTDPRPINDKNYQQNCIRVILQFLQSHGFNMPMTVKQLSSPTKIDFMNLITFIYHVIDPNEKLEGKIEDEVPALFKRLGYPFPISKSGLSAVGSPHTWPALLSALRWLVDGWTAVERSMSITQRREEEGKAAFDEFINKAYPLFLEAKDDLVESMKQELQQKMAISFSSREKMNLELEREVLLLEEEVRAQKEGPSPKQLALTKKEQWAENIAKFDKCIAGVLEKEEEFERELERRKQELVEKEEEEARLLADIKELKEKVSSQRVTVEQVNNWRRGQGIMAGELRVISALKKEKMESILAKEMQIPRERAKLNELVLEYNVLMTKLKLIPETAKQANGIILEIALREDATSAQEYFNIDLKAVVKPHLAEVLKERRAKCCAKSSELSAIHSEENALCTEIEARKAYIQSLAAKLKKREADHKRAAEMHRAEIEDKLKEIEETEVDIFRMRSDRSLEVESENHAAALQDLMSAETELRRRREVLKTRSLTLVRKHMDAKDRITQQMLESRKKLEDMARQVKAPLDAVWARAHGECSATALVMEEGAAAAGGGTDLHVSPRAPPHEEGIEGLVAQLKSTDDDSALIATNEKDGSDLALFPLTNNETL
ncbi:hypothetical protein CBR_g55876 [Chara braunii]|uniref:Kinetochore protein NDC80 n=1 Tax=Chara braunii TaxID=69332 RepID=A0A388MDA6_CHABU|nr:hypothetical protein CBR_g55876 [Chara braunii]|eukprot:GBG92541.1 hypothetical protein CBR_g55876 [Chara braunii]